MKTVCVFCGSMAGDDQAYTAAAVETGIALARRGVEIVYGGGRVGMMGALADAALNAGGRVVGVIPRAMVELELAHPAASEMHIVRTMHERKGLMHRLSDAFIALPGGFGTMDELFEALTWSQLGIHKKPCGVLNVKGYFDPLLEFLDQASRKGFIPPDHRAMLIDDTSPKGLLKNFEQFIERGKPHERM